jgi:hypothetical protein
MSTPSTETPVDQPDAGNVRFFIEPKSDPNQVNRQVVKLLHEFGGYSEHDPNTGYVYARWDLVKARCGEIMADKIVTIGTTEDKRDHSIIIDELYIALYGEDAPGADGEPVHPPELAEAVKFAKSKSWGFLNKGTTGYVNHRQSDLVMVDDDVTRAGVDSRTGRTISITLRGRYLTANHKILSLQVEHTVQKILDDAYIKANKYVKMVGDRVEELRGPLAKKSKAIAAESAKKFTYANPAYVAELAAGSSNGAGAAAEATD